MANVAYNKWQAISVALLDALADDGGFVEASAVVDRALNNTSGDRLQFERALVDLVKFGAVRCDSSTGIMYCRANSHGADGVRAMAQVWKGNFPK